MTGATPARIVHAFTHLYVRTTMADATNLPADAPGPGSESDLTTRARLRNAAIRVITREGLGRFTARRVASEAGVSPGLIAHHFASMDGLRRACDKYVARVVHDQELETIEGGGTYDLLTVLRSGEASQLLGYLAAVLSEPSRDVDELVDELVDNAETYLALAETRGLVRSTRDPRRRAQLVVLRSLGALVLHHHAARLTGVDPTDLASADPADVTSVAVVATELDGHGLYTDTHTERLLAELDQRGQQER